MPFASYELESSNAESGFLSTLERVPRSICIGLLLTSMRRRGIELLLLYTAPKIRDRYQFESK